jgi:nucleoside-triphosphatase THEP1
MIIVLTGDIGSGKTTLLKEVCLGGSAPAAGRPKGDRPPLAGFLSLRVLGGPRTEGYDLLDIRDGTLRPFLRRTRNPGGERIGDYAVLGGGLDYANATIRGSRPSDLLVVDELGPLELDGRGFWPSLSEVLQDRGRRFLVVVRTGLVDRFKKLFKGHRVKIIRLDDRARVVLEREFAIP